MSSTSSPQSFVLCSSVPPISAPQISLAPSSTLEIASSIKNSVIIELVLCFHHRKEYLQHCFDLKVKVVVFFAWYSCLRQRSDTNKKLQSWFPSPTFSQSAARTESVTKVVLNPLLWLVWIYSLFTKFGGDLRDSGTKNVHSKARRESAGRRGFHWCVTRGPCRNGFIRRSARIRRVFV